MKNALPARPRGSRIPGSLPFVLLTPGASPGQTMPGNIHDIQLEAAGMGPEHIVKVNTYLADRAHAAENAQIRRAVLGDLRPALTIIIAEIYDPAWLLEIEVVAAMPMDADRQPETGP